jgi:hypothetical protein
MQIDHSASTNLAVSGARGWREIPGQNLAALASPKGGSGVREVPPAATESVRYRRSTPAILDAIAAADRARPAE